MPLDASARSSCLADEALRGLKDTFALTGHAPSNEQWGAITDLLAHLQRAADGELPAAVYLSPIPAGTGKSASLIAFAKALMADGGRSAVGMLVTCNRVEEVKAMASNLQPWRHRLCVIVGQDNADVRALGDHEEANAAQLVICTHEAMRRTLKPLPSSSSFDDASRFHYQGHRRAVVAWDEAFAFSRPVVLDPDAAAGLTKAIGVQSTAARAALLDWVRSIEPCHEGECYVPDFAALGVDFRRLEEAVGDDGEGAAQVAALKLLSGGTGYIVRDNLTGGALVSHVPEIPESLMPVIVTDASAARGVHHESYQFMAHSRPGQVIWLTEADKTYGNLTLRIVPTAASRSVYRDTKEPRGRALVEMAVTYIRRVAPDPVLVIGYRNWFTMKGVKERTIEEAIKVRLTAAERDRVRFLTWGRHTATNEHRECRHVVLMGLNHLPNAAVHAAAGAALDVSMRTADPADHPSVSQVDTMRRGMLRDSTMQALLRGAARMGVNGDCGTMAAVIPQVRRSGLSEDDYRGMFPGVELVEDTTLLPRPKLKGKLLKLSRIVEARLAAGETEMAYPDLRGELGVRDHRNFAKLVKASEWTEWTAAQGLISCQIGPRRANGLRRG